MEISKSCLVIDARKLAGLSLDGPALKIRMSLQSSRLFPLCRLARIHVLGSLQAGFDALLHCAEQQIPVAFYTLKGKLRCQLYYPVFEQRFLSHWLDHMDFDSQVKQQYQDWLANQTLFLLASIEERDGIHQSRADLCREKIHHQCKQSLGEQRFHEAGDWLQGFMLAQLSQILVSLGLPNQSRNKRLLQEDLEPLCLLWLLHQLARHCQKRPLHKIDAYSMSTFYEQHADSLDYIIRRMLVQLSSALEAII